MKWQSKNNALYFWSRTSWIMYSQAGLTTSPAIWSSGKIRNIWKAWSCDRCPWSWCCPCDVEPEWQDLLAEINDHEPNDHFLAGVFSRSLWTDPSFCGWKWTRWPNTDEWLFYDPWYRANDDLSWRQARAIQVVGSIWCQCGLRPVDQLHWKRTREDMVEDAEKKDREARFVSIWAWLLKTHICLKCEFFYFKIGIFPNLTHKQSERKQCCQKCKRNRKYHIQVPDLCGVIIVLFPFSDRKNQVKRPWFSLCLPDYTSYFILFPIIRQ